MKNILIIFILLSSLTFGQNLFWKIEMMNSPDIETPTPTPTGYEVNGDFDANITGWVANSTPVTLEWVASGGGFTGAAHIVGNSQHDGMVQGVSLFDDAPPAGDYIFSADVYIVSKTATGVRIGLFDETLTYIDTTTALGLTHLEGLVTYARVGDFQLQFRQLGTGNIEFYVDNIRFLPVEAAP